MTAFGDLAPDRPGWREEQILIGAAVGHNMAARVELARISRSLRLEIGLLNSL
jgi:hypothetical protein